MEKSKKIFNELDEKKIGFIYIDDFLDNISEKHSQKQSEFHPFFDFLMKELVGKSEKIIFKLQKLKNKAFISSDTEALEEIDW